MDAETVDKPGPVRGIDRGVARRQAFLEAARHVFLDQGFEAASVNDIVRLAGGSLATLYAQFGNKEGLFLAVTQEQHDAFVRAILPDCVEHLPLEQGLQQIGEQYLRALLERENLAFYRIIVGEGRKFPQLLQRYILLGADKVRDALTDYLRVAAPATAEPETVASYFFEVLRSRHHYLSLADDRYSLSDAQVSEHVHKAVGFLLNGMGWR